MIKKPDEKTFLNALLESWNCLPRVCRVTMID